MLGGYSRGVVAWGVPKYRGPCGLFGVPKVKIPVRVLPEPEKVRPERASLPGLWEKKVCGKKAEISHGPMFVCLFVCAYDSRYACGGTATAETTFLGCNPQYTRVTAEETRCRIAY